MRENEKQIIMFVAISRWVSSICQCVLCIRDGLLCIDLTDSLTMCTLCSQCEKYSYRAYLQLLCSSVPRSDTEIYRE